MAGIGVKLNNIYGKNTLTTDVIGMGYSTVMTIAPMLTVIGALCIMEYFLDFSSVGYVTRELFSCTVLYIFIFALLTAQKAYDIAIDAMKILKDHGVKAKWYVLGEGELRDRLQIKINHLGLKDDFILLGAKTNPYPYYAQCDLYVHATLFEGKSIAIQEAQILGCTLLVSDCSGNREQVIDGVDGKMCQLTPEGISAGIEELLSDEEKCREYGKKASEKLTAEKEDVLQMFRFNDN